MNTSKIIFLTDGSVKTSRLNSYVMQGNNLSDEFIIAVKNAPNDEYQCGAYFQLPNGEYNTLTGVPYDFTEEEEGVTVNYKGWKVTLLNAQTKYAGSLVMSLRIFKTVGTVEQDLFTYPIYIVVNSTGTSVVASETYVSAEVLNQWQAQLATYQIKYNLNNVRYYDSVPSAEELEKMSNGQVFVYKNTDNEDIFASVVKDGVNPATYNNITNFSVSNNDGTDKITIGQSTIKHGNATYGFNPADTGNKIFATEETVGGNYLKLDGTNAMQADLNVGSHKVVGVSDPVINTDATNKGYVDTADTLLQSNITAEETRATGVEGGLNTRLGTAEGNITTLQQEVIRIEDSKNIADIVGTYADLLAYPSAKLAKLRIDDIIEVLADENRPAPDTGGTTMYRLTQKTPTVVWTYVGIIHIPAGQLNNTYVRRDGAYAMTSNLNLGGNAIQNVANPTNGTDATNKQTSEAFTNNKVFRIIDSADTYDLKIQIIGDDAQLIATER